MSGLANSLKNLNQSLGSRPVDGDQALTVLGKSPHGGVLPSKLRITAWNLCKGVGRQLFMHDLRILLQSSDLVLTQEAVLNHDLRSVFSKAEIHGVHAGSFRRRDGLVDGVMTISRFAPSSRTERVVFPTPEPIAQTPKTALITTFPIAGNRDGLLVVNLHARLIRRQSAALSDMRFLMERLPEHRGPAIVAGDFNTFQASHLRRLRELMDAAGFEFVAIADDPRRRRDTLDQAFVRGATVKAAWIETSVKNSDHFPLRMEIEIPDE